MRLAVIIAALLAAACASTHTAPAQSYRMKGAADVINITGKIDREDRVLAVNHILTVSLNQKPALTGSIGYGTGDLSGTWNGKPLMALCNMQGDYLSHYAIHCRIVIDGEFATTLTF
jgi:hypothetical protein